MSPNESRAVSDASAATAWVSALLLLSGAVALNVLLGWALQIDAMKRIAPGLTSMNPLTAVCFLLCCLALWLRRRPDSGSRSSLISGLAASTALLLGASKLLDLGLGTQICPDDLLFASQLDEGQAYPSRMAPNTASCFLLLGAAILMIDAGRARLLRPSHWLGLPIVLMALLAVVGYLYDTSDFYKLKNYIPMALHTAVSFLMLWLALMLSRTGTGLMAMLAGEGEAARNGRWLLPLCVLVPVLLGWLQLQGQRHELYALGTGTSLLVIGLVIVLVLGVLLGGLRLHGLEQRREAASQALAQRIEQQTVQTQWQNRLLQLDERARAARGDIDAALPAILAELLQAVGAPMGALYARGNGDFAVLVRHACKAPESEADSSRVSGGLVDQCARDGQLLELGEVPPQYWRIQTATLDIPPQQLHLQPVRLDDEVVGVIELALLRPLDAARREYLDAAARILSFLLFRRSERRQRF